MRDGNVVGVLKTSTGRRGGILTLLACGAFACSEVNLDPVAIGGSAGSGSNGGSAGSLSPGGTGGSNAGDGGSSGTGGTGGTAGAGGSSGTGGSGGTSNGTGGTGGGDTGPINFIANSDFEAGLAPWTMIAQQGTIVLSTDCDGPQDPETGVSDAGVSDAGVSDASVSDASVPDAGPSEPERPHGFQCGRGTGRTAEYQGPAYPLNGVLTRGQRYKVSAYGRIANASSAMMKLTMRVICQDENGIGLPIIYANLVTPTPVTDRDWLFMSSEYIVPGTQECPTMTDIRLYLEGPPGGVDILVDDVSIYKL